MQCGRRAGIAEQADRHAIHHEEGRAQDPPVAQDAREGMGMSVASSARSTRNSRSTRCAGGRAAAGRLRGTSWRGRLSEDNLDVAALFDGPGEGAIGASPPPM
ncbi:hypothetical protein C7T35_28890 [Variovorax sp. WS11]|nr:hypothetical protein C7T35_28890 [Variovorax sp. WS11]